MQSDECEYGTVTFIYIHSILLCTDSPLVFTSVLHSPYSLFFISYIPQVVCPCFYFTYNSITPFLSSLSHLEIPSSNLMIPFYFQHTPPHTNTHTHAHTHPCTNRVYMEKIYKKFVFLNLTYFI